jgi:hypothetical protein
VSGWTFATAASRSHDTDAAEPTNAARIRHLDRRAAEDRRIDQVLLGRCRERPCGVGRNPTLDAYLTAEQNLRFHGERALVPATVVTCPQTEPGRAARGRPVGECEGSGITRGGPEARRGAGCRPVEHPDSASYK